MTISSGFVAQPKRCAIYARFSTDRQNERSINDQIAICRTMAEREGFVVVEAFEDRAMSGASMHGRAGIQELLAKARDRRFDVVIAETMSRLGRNQRDRADIREKLQFNDIQLMTPADGVVTPLVDSIRAVIDSQYLDDLKVMVRRGMAGVVREGRHAGGRAYGYRAILGRPGELEVIPEEKEIVRRIFREYVSGASPRSIAAGLNLDGIQPPRGIRWNASTINGNRARGHGIIQNSIYRGQIVWNRVRMVKDPETGKRISRPNPKQEWHYEDAPHLRILDEEVAEAALLRKRALSTEQARHQPRSKRLLSGLLRCGACGGGMMIIGRDRSGPRIQCSTMRESGSCTNKARYYVEKIEKGVVGALRTKLANPALVQEYVREYVQERRSIECEARRNRAQIERALADADAGIARLVKALAKDIMTEDEVAHEMRPLRADQDRLKGELAVAAEDTATIAMHPQAITRFRENIEELAVLLATGEKADAGLVAPFRALVERVVVKPRKSGEPHEVEIIGYLAALTGLSAMAMVAEEGLEPPTRGL
jgi:site-specific DNA recombinase